MIKITKDGRTIRTRDDYAEFRRNVHMSQEGKCYKCGRWMNFMADLMSDNSMHTHHIDGRGLGGCWRDDTLEKCIGLCGSCHRKEHNQ